MTSQTNAQYIIAEENFQYYLRNFRDEKDIHLFSVCDRLVNLDFDIPEISDEDFNNGQKKV